MCALLGRGGLGTNCIQGPLMSRAEKMREGAMFRSSYSAECMPLAKFCSHCAQQINEATQNTTKKDNEGHASGK